MRRLALFGLLLALPGCTVGPNFTPPAPQLPATWHDAAAQPGDATSQADPDPRWWTSFHDPVLDDLIRRATAGNLDLQQSVYRIAEARLQEISAQAAGLPSITGNAHYTREQLGLKGLLEEHHADSLASQYPQAAPLLNQITAPVDLYQAGFDASWELDLFGRVRRSAEAAHAETQAAIENRNDALVTLEAEVAADYARLRGAQADTAIAQDNVRIERGLLELTSARARGGLVTDLDVERATAQVTATAAQLPQYEQAAAQAMNELSVLTGQPPGALDPLLSAPKPVPAAPPDVPIGLPASLARRRPDIRAAEARLHAQTAETGVAVARLFPDISLTGQVGTRANEAAYLTRWVSLFYSFGPSISLPIFQGGQLTAGVKLAKAEQAAAALDYQKVVLNALREIENALVAYRTEQARRAMLIQSAASDTRALDLARDRYRQGMTSFIDVLTADSTLVQTREALTQSTLTVLTDLISLYKALGGGWQDTASETPAIGTVGNGGQPLVPAVTETAPSLLHRLISP